MMTGPLFQWQGCHPGRHGHRPTATQVSAGLAVAGLRRKMEENNKCPGSQCVRVSCTRAQKGQTSHLRASAWWLRCGGLAPSQCQCHVHSVQCPQVPGSSTHWPVVPTPPPPLTPVTHHGLLQPPGQPRAAAQTGLRQLPLPRGVHNHHPQGLWRQITREPIHIHPSEDLC